MDNLVELVTFIGAGFLGVFVLRFLKPNIKKQNTEVIIKVDKLEKANNELETKIEEILIILKSKKEWDDWYQ